MKLEPNFYLTAHQKRLLSGILSHINENIVFDEELIEDWKITINGEPMWIGDREKSALKVILERLQRSIFR